MTSAQRATCLEQVARGVPPFHAAELAGASLMSLAKTLEQDAAFRGEWDSVWELLGQNVATMVYRLAMQGDVAAQKCFLQLRQGGRRGANVNHPPSQSPDEMADDELLSRFQRDAPLLLAQLARRGVEKDGDDLSGDVPDAAASAG